MRTRTRIGMALMFGGVIAIPIAIAQRPGDGPERSLSKSADADDLASRMMAFDADKDGTLTKSEVTDGRLLRLFDRADVDKDGNVTKAELTALGEKEHAEGGGFGGPGGGPPPGFGPGGMSRPGEVLPQGLQQRLGLSSEQKAQLDALQKEVDGRLETILSSEQKAQLREMRQRGPGGGRRPGGPGGGPPPR